MLDTPSGRLVKSLYERGCKLGVSSRGWASLRDLPGKCYKCIMANFELITFDFVTEPSTKGAWLLPYAGRYSQPIPSQATAEAMSRLGVGAVPQEQLAQVPRVRDLQAGFAEFQRRLQARALHALDHDRRRCAHAMPTVSRTCARLGAAGVTSAGCCWVRMR